MAAGTPLVSELLCFIQNNISGVAKNDLISRIIGFYTVEDIVEAKNLLFETAAKLKTDGLIVDIPRSVARRNGDGKRKADAEDTLELWERLDVAQAVIPTFCAVNLSRLPPLTFSDADVCSLSALVLDMKGQLSVVQSNLSDLSTHVYKADSESKAASARPGAQTATSMKAVLANSAPVQAAPSASTAPTTTVVAQRSWADQVNSGSPSRSPPDPDGFMTVRKKTKPPRRTWCGKRAGDDGK